MATKLTPTLLSEYFNNKRKHKGYKLSVELYENLKVHAEGETPEELIAKMRPSETLDVFNYRKSIYEPITESPVGRILNYISKMRKSRDWIINFPPMETNLIKEEETLQYYLESGFPYFDNVTNWLFTVLLKNYLIDANAVLATVPLNAQVEQGEYVKPYPIIFNSPQVIEFKENDFCILHSTDKCEYSIGETTRDDGNVYFVITPEFIERYEQTSAEGAYNMVYQYAHLSKTFPARKLKGFFHKALDTCYIYKSRINSIVPHLNKAARESSDLDAEVVQHVHSTPWYYVNNECSSCNGTGLLLNWTPPQDDFSATPPVCSTCNGSRYISHSPYKAITINPGKGLETSAPIPPGGFIEKQVDIVKIQDERIENHIYNAFASIEMQNLAKTPANQSGVAKDMDMSQQEIFLHSVGEDLINILDWYCKVAVDFRYSTIIPNDKDRYKMLPMIPVPEKFNLLDSSYLINELKTAKEANVNPVILQSMEVELAGKQFASNPSMKKKLELVIKLDPLYGKTTDQKNLEKLNGGIIEEDYVLSCMILPFVNKALLKEKDFANLPDEKQWEILYGYVGEHIANNSAEARVKKLIPAQ